MTPDELADRLATVLDAPVSDLQRLTGGASRETWSFRSGDRRLILQRERTGTPRPGSMENEALLLQAAAAAGVPVAEVVASGAGDTPLGTGYLVSQFVDGESIARRILRDDAYRDARGRLAAQCGKALAAVHSIPPTDLQYLEPVDQLRQYREVLDGLGDSVPMFEFAFRWLEERRPPSSGQTVVHGDFRLGNVLVGPDGLRAVVDWELAHLGDPMEDLSWMCVRAWRFGGQLPVAGVGRYEELFDAYSEHSGRSVDHDAFRWWEVLGTLKWGIMCILQARAHLDGLSRSVELAAIGRRVCENEHDLLLLLAPEALAAAVASPGASGAHDPGLSGDTDTAGMHGRPTAAELVEAVRDYIDGDVRPATEGRVRFHGLVASNVLAIVQRELELGPAMAAAQVRRLGGLGVGSDADLADAIRSGRFDDRTDELLAVVAEAVVDKLRVANPDYFT